MVIASYVMFAIALLASVIHLYFCFREQEKLRKITKLFCLGFLSISLILRLPNYPLIYLGLIFGMIGDYFMIKKERPKSLLLGIITFFVGHVFYSLQILTFMNTPNWGFVMFFVAYMALALTLVLVIYPRMKYLAHGATAPGTAYFTMLASMLILSMIYGFASDNWIGSLLLVIGYATFIASDSILLYTSFVKQWKRADFYIMLTYLSAEFLIAIALAMTVLIL